MICLHTNYTVCLMFLNRPHILTLLVFVVLSSCKEASTVAPAAGGENLTITRQNLNAAGGDPRGSYVPNTPVVRYLGELNESLTSARATGAVVFSGASPSNGTFSSLIATSISGTIGATIFPAFPYSDSTSGTWNASGSSLFLHIHSRTDTLSFTADSNAIYFVMSYFSTRAPITVNLQVHEPLSPDDSTVWAFRR